ncbi:hypothetical protein [Brucella tritici]|uniref:hypothetical protein n=1 Tax=Brucella tritici TaxID=94626 RepID=UPI0020006A42|nr:hypothetical protein [Brucella tritici]
MASELKPCICGKTPRLNSKKGSAGITKTPFYREQIVCRCGVSSKIFKAPNKAVEAWNTRAAPAATDTGLETVGYVTPEWLAKHCSSHTINSNPSPAWTEAVVTSSQAEELLAEKDKEIAYWVKETQRCLKYAQSLADDNAAKDARIKEIENEWRVAANLGSEVNRKLALQVVSLEAKLAAAEKVRKAAEHVVWFDWSDNDDDAVKAVSDLRSALEGQPYKCEWQQRAETAETKLAASETLLHGIVAAWESLPGGRNYSTSEVQAWIIGPMQKAINRIRAVLGWKPS